VASGFYDVDDAPTGSMRAAKGSEEAISGGDDAYYRRRAPSLGGAAVESRGMLDDYDEKFFRDPRETWLEGGNYTQGRFGGGPAVPSIEAQAAEQQKQHDAMDYLHGGEAVPAEAAGNWAMHQWQRINANPVTRLPAMADDDDPSQAAQRMDLVADNFSRFEGGDSIYEKPVRGSVKPRKQKPVGDPNSRGLLDRFDDEFAQGPLNDDNLDDADLSKLSRFNVMKGGAPYGPDAPRRDSNYMNWYGKVIPNTPVRAKSPEEEQAQRDRTYRKMRYEDEDGRQLKDSDPRTRGTGEAPLERRPGFFSRMGRGISNWWRGSRLNWSNWGRRSTG